jgi:hypothetical protein
MTDPVGNLGRALQMLRTAMATTRATAAGHRGPLPAVARQTPAAPRQTASPQPGQVAMLAQRLVAVDGELPVRRKKALRLFVAAVLTDEFGHHIELDPELQTLVERVATALESDAHSAEIVDLAIDPLINPAKRDPEPPA